MDTLKRYVNSIVEDKRRYRTALTVTILIWVLDIAYIAYIFLTAFAQVLLALMTLGATLMDGPIETIGEVELMYHLIFLILLPMTGTITLAVARHRYKKRLKQVPASSPKELPGLE